MTGKFWMIVDIAQVNPGFMGDFVDKNKAPRFMHYLQYQAESELLRLQTKYPDGEFVMLEAVAVAIPKALLTVEPIPPELLF